MILVLPYKKPARLSKKMKEWCSHAFLLPVPKSSESAKKDRKPKS